jgi:hypothetical protein
MPPPLSVQPPESSLTHLRMTRRTALVVGPTLECRSRSLSASCAPADRARPSQCRAACIRPGPGSLSHDSFPAPIGPCYAARHFLRAHEPCSADRLSPFCTDFSGCGRPDANGRPSHTPTGIGQVALGLSVAPRAYYREFVQLERHCGIDVGRLSWIEGKFRLECRVDRVGNSEVVMAEVCRIVASSDTPAPSGRRQST